MRDPLETSLSQWDLIFQVEILNNDTKNQTNGPNTDTVKRGCMHNIPGWVPPCSSQAKNISRNNRNMSE